MKKIIYLAIFLLLFTFKGFSQIDITGPTSVNIGGSSSLSITTSLVGYNYFWTISNNSIATISYSGVNATIQSTGTTTGTITVFVYATKDPSSPVYCDSVVLNITQPFNICANNYRIDDISCSPNFNVNGWKFQLVDKNTGVPVNPSNLVWSGSNQGITYFIVDGINGGELTGHPNPVNQPQTPPYLQFSVFCKVGDCTFFYKNYVDGGCGNGKTGYLNSSGSMVETGN